MYKNVRRYIRGEQAPNITQSAGDNSTIQLAMDKFEEDPKPVKEEGDVLPSTWVTNGSIDFRGRISDKRTTGGWNAAPFIIANEVAERLAFFSIAVNLTAYLVQEMHKTTPTAATLTNDWTGAAYLLTFIGAFLADAYLGRFKTIIYFSCVYAIGMVLLTISASIDSLRPPPCKARPCIEANDGQNAFLFAALALVAIGTGGIKPCVSSFGADQYDEADETEVKNKFGFFNWFFFAINMGAVSAVTLMVFVQHELGYTWGFGIPTGVMVLSIVLLAAGIPCYRYQKPMGSPFTRFFQVIVVALRNHFKGVEAGRDADLYEVKTKESDIHGARKLAHTPEYSFWDKAAVIKDPSETNTKNRWRLCTVTQVEEFKSLLRVLPICVTTLSLALSFAQVSTFFLSQAALTDRKLGPNFTIPTGSVAIFIAIDAIILIPIYQKWMVPVLRKFTGHHRGLTSLQRIGVGLFLSIFSFISAALVEKKRLDHPGLSVFWLFPQFFLMGTAEVFAYVGQLEFFYDEATDGTRSISNALFLSEIGIGSFLSTALVKIIVAATGGLEKGWLRHDLNKSRLDFFYWIVAGIDIVFFLAYLRVACRFKGRENGSVIDESILELAGHNASEEKL